MDEEADNVLHYCKKKEHHHHLKLELNQGLEFDSPEAAYDFYNAYAEQSGFYIRVSRNEGSITCRRFVCSEEACEAFLMVQLNDSGKWVVACFLDEHNHPLLDKTNIELNSHHLRQCNGNHWYPTLHSYFQVRLAEDSGFYYAFQVDESGRTGSVFWADGRSKFLYTQFGDSIVFDTSYRSMRNKDLARFASFVGVNHYKKPVLLGCALISDDECEECFTWVFLTWIKAMGGQPPRWIIADQDEAIRSSMARVFPKTTTRHRFSTWQIKEEEQRLFLTMGDDGMFKHEYKYCISRIQCKSVFESDWNLLLDKYNLNDNLWLNEMYRTLENWALPYISIPHFAGIPINDDGNAVTFFGDSTFVTQQLPATEFLTHYIKVVKQHRDRENKDNFMPINSQLQLVNIHPIYPIEYQCRQLYTNVMFVDFQKEISKCFEYKCMELEREGQYDRYLVFKLGENGMYDKHGVFKIEDQRFDCTCFMFELKGLICTHVLKVFEFLNIHQIPSRYILHRWTNNAKTCCVRDFDSIRGMPAHFEDLMLQSLQEEARDYCKVGASTFEKYKIALKFLRKCKSLLSNQS